jgi:cytochrome c-type biogenesis protein CcmH
MTNTISTLKQQLQQLRELHDAGALPASHYEESKALLERRLVDLVMQGAVEETPAAGAGLPAAGSVAHPVTPEAPQKISRALLVALAAGVLVLAGAGYWWKGAPAQFGAVSSAPAAGGASSGAANPGAGTGAAPHATGSEQIVAMTEKLATRLKAQPNDSEGWAMLARSYTVLGRHPEALKAYEQAVAQRNNDPDLLADYADSLAVKNNRTLAGEPMKWVEKALKQDPRNLKALSLAGSAAFERKDYAGAVKYWEQVVSIGPADSNHVQQAQGALAEARELGGLPAAKVPVAAASAAGPAPVSLSGKTVGGTVTLSPALAKQVASDDTVFILARVGGRGMPLAILRKKVSDLPLKFTLDDSLSMSPAALLSGASTVVVGARISKSGNAMPQNGDLSGQSEPVPLGESGLKIEIRDVVKQ